MAKPLRIAVIGAGRWGKNIIKALEGLPECRIAYIEKRDYHKLIKKEDIDAVVIATPGTLHARAGLPFIKRGLPVFIEKPLTTNLADAQKLKKETRKSGSNIFVGHIYRYSPAYEKTRELSKKIKTIPFFFL